MKEVENIKEFPVAKDSNSKDLASAVTLELLKEGGEGKIILTAVGVQAVNQMVKAVAIAGGYVGKNAKVINTRIGFKNGTVEDEGKLKTISVIRMLCIISD